MPKIFSLPIHSDLADKKIAPNFNRISIDSTEYVNSFIRLFKLFRWKQLCFVINPVADYQNLMTSFETYAEPENITIPNLERIIDIQADQFDPEVYGPPS